jgi:hypothetical protein
MNGDAGLSLPAPSTKPRLVDYRYRRWLRGMADMTIGFALVGSAVCVPIVVSQNRKLRSDVKQAVLSAASAGTLERTVRHNIEVSALEGKTLPEPLAGKIRSSLGARLKRLDGGLLVFAYTPVVCERTLNDGLTSLQNSRALHKSDAVVYMLVGERSVHDRERALLARAQAQLTGPIAFLPADGLLSAIAPGADSAFADEPLFLRLDRDLTIRSAFHADQYRPALLDAWLETIE